MPWKVQNVSEVRAELVQLMSAEGANVSELCRRFGVSRKTAYKWLERFQAAGAEGLVDRSRRPLTSPTQTPEVIEQRILELRDEHPAWGGRKLGESLRREGTDHRPAPSTITEILRRNGRLVPEESARHRPFIRFEHPQPNDLWQMDFKGHFALGCGGRCHPLTILDDHSRYSLTLDACGDERGETVKTRLQAVFRRYGLPRAMLMDNGAPWSGESQSPDTLLTVWLMRLGIRVKHGRPYHPQTQGKEERFHRTLKLELLSRRTFADLEDCQAHFDPWRHMYNFDRPHEALDMASPASRYRASSRSFPETLPEQEFSPGDQTRKVQDDGTFSFQGRQYQFSRAFHRQAIALRPTSQDGLWIVLYFQNPLGVIDQRDNSPDGQKVSRQFPRD